MMKTNILEKKEKSDRVPYESLISESDYWKKKCDVLEKDLFKVSTQNKKLDIENKKLQEKINENSKQTNNTSSAFLLPSEFKSNWEIMTKDVLIEAFDACSDNPDIFSFVVLIATDIIYKSAEDQLISKLTNILNILNLNNCEIVKKESVNDKGLKEIKNFLPRFRNLFQEYCSSIFICNETIINEIKAKIIQVIQETNLQTLLSKYLNTKVEKENNDILKKEYTNYYVNFLESLGEKIDDIKCDLDSKYFDNFATQFFKMSIYMVLHDQEIFISCDKWPDYNYFNKNDYICIEGFAKENSICSIILKPPLTKKNFSYLNIQPAVYIINNSSDLIEMICNENFDSELKVNKKRSQTPDVRTHRNENCEKINLDYEKPIEVFEIENNINDEIKTLSKNSKNEQISATQSSKSLVLNKQESELEQDELKNSKISKYSKINNNQTSERNSKSISIKSKKIIPIKIEEIDGYNFSDINYKKIELKKNFDQEEIDSNEAQIRIESKSNLYNDNFNSSQGSKFNKNSQLSVSNKSNQIQKINSEKCSLTNKTNKEMEINELSINKDYCITDIDNKNEENIDTFNEIEKIKKSEKEIAMNIPCYKDENSPEFKFQTNSNNYNFYKTTDNREKDKILKEKSKTNLSNTFIMSNNTSLSFLNDKSNLNKSNLSNNFNQNGNSSLFKKQGNVKSTNNINNLHKEVKNLFSYSLVNKQNKNSANVFDHIINKDIIKNKYSVDNFDNLNETEDMDYNELIKEVENVTKNNSSLKQISKDSLIKTTKYDTPTNYTSNKTNNCKVENVQQKPNVKVLDKHDKQSNKYFLENNECLNRLENSHFNTIDEHNIFSNNLNQSNNNQNLNNINYAFIKNSNPKTKENNQILFNNQNTNFPLKLKGKGATIVNTNIGNTQKNTAFHNNLNSPILGNVSNTHSSRQMNTIKQGNQINNKEDQNSSRASFNANISKKSPKENNLGFKKPENKFSQVDSVKISDIKEITIEKNEVKNDKYIKENKSSMIKHATSIRKFNDSNNNLNLNKATVQINTLSNTANLSSNTNPKKSNIRTQSASKKNNVQTSSKPNNPNIENKSILNTNSINKDKSRESSKIYNNMTYNNSKLKNNSSKFIKSNNKSIKQEPIFTDESDKKDRQNTIEIKKTMISNKTNLNCNLFSLSNLKSSEDEGFINHNNKSSFNEKLDFKSFTQKIINDNPYVKDSISGFSESKINNNNDNVNINNKSKNHKIQENNYNNINNNLIRNNDNMLDSLYPNEVIGQGQSPKNMALKINYSSGKSNKKTIEKFDDSKFENKNNLTNSFYSNPYYLNLIDKYSDSNKEIFFDSVKQKNEIKRKEKHPNFSSIGTPNQNHIKLYSRNKETLEQNLSSIRNSGSQQSFELFNKKNYVSKMNKTENLNETAELSKNSLTKKTSDGLSINNQGMKKNISLNEFSSNKDLSAKNKDKELEFIRDIGKLKEEIFNAKSSVNNSLYKQNPNIENFSNVQKNEIVGNNTNDISMKNKMINFYTNKGYSEQQQSISNIQSIGNNKNKYK